MICFIKIVFDSLHSVSEKKQKLEYVSQEVKIIYENSKHDRRVKIVDIAG